MSVYEVKGPGGGRRGAVGGGDDVGSGLDLDGAMAACGLDEFADRPAGLALDPAADRQRGEHGGQVRPAAGSSHGKSGVTTA